MPIIIGAKIANYFNSTEYGWVAGIVSIVILVVLYFSKVGWLYSIIFSLLWGWLGGWMVHVKGWSWLGTTVIALVFFVISFGIHEYHRKKSTEK